MATSKSTLPGRDTLDGRLEAQRQALFRATGIVGSVRRVLEDSGSPIDGAIDQNTPTDAWTALAAAQELLDHVAGELDPAVILEQPPAEAEEARS